MTISDEMLTAYLDGELAAEEMAEIVRQIKKSPQLASRVEKMCLTDKSLAEAYHAIDDRPMPAGIMEMLEAFPEKIKNADNDISATVLPFKKPQPVSKAPIWQMAMAASVALIIGLGLGRNILTPDTTLNSFPEAIQAQQVAGIIGPENPLFGILENQPSASSVALKGSKDTMVEPIMTFLASDNTYCREFKVMTAQSATRNIACRVNNNWLVKVSVGTSGEVVSPDGQYQTASRSGDTIVDSMIVNMIRGDALSADIEARIMKQNWQQK